MKVNLNRLLESRDHKREEKAAKETTAVYVIKTIADETSADDVYSFEIEKESFTLNG